MTDAARTNETLPPHLRPWFYATKPTWWTRFLRTFLPWQVVRFIVINLKMLVLIRRSHRGLRH
ncbi:MAG: hypothetical protein ACPL7M_01915 [Bryobacteraceae bacterium]